MLDAEGKVWGTGYNGNGQLGIGNTTLQTLPQQMTSISGIKEISAKSNNTYMLTEGGYVEGVGYNYYSQLGDGSSTDRTTAVYTKTHQTNMYQMQNIFQQEKTQYLYQERRTQKEIHKECM